MERKQAKADRRSLAVQNLLRTGPKGLTLEARSPPGLRTLHQAPRADSKPATLTLTPLCVKTHVAAQMIGILPRTADEMVGLGGIKDFLNPRSDPASGFGSFSPYRPEDLEYVVAGDRIDWLVDDQSTVVAASLGGADPAVTIAAFGLSYDLGLILADQTLTQETVVRVALGDGVSPSSVPEPATWAMMCIGLGLTGRAMRLRSRRLQSKATVHP